VDQLQQQQAQQNQYWPTSAADLACNNKGERKVPQEVAEQLKKVGIACCSDSANGSTHIILSYPEAPDLFQEVADQQLRNDVTAACSPSPSGLVQIAEKLRISGNDCFRWAGGGQQMPIAACP
jgi:hypothetical protein